MISVLACHSSCRCPEGVLTRGRCSGGQSGLSVRSYRRCRGCAGGRYCSEAGCTVGAGNVVRDNCVLQSCSVKNIVVKDAISEPASEIVGHGAVDERRIRVFPYGLSLKGG